MPFHRLYHVLSIVLFYQSIDATACGYFNVATAGWQELPGVFETTGISAVSGWRFRAGTIAPGLIINGGLKITF